jgi:hypothetical protein
MRTVAALKKLLLAAVGALCAGGWRAEAAASIQFALAVVRRRYVWVGKAMAGEFARNDDRVGDQRGMIVENFIARRGINPNLVSRSVLRLAFSVCPEETQT